MTLAANPDLAAEADHRIANNLSLIASLVRMRVVETCKEPLKLDTGQVRLILEEFADRLDAVARLRRSLANRRGVQSVEIASYLRAITTAVISSLTSAGEIDLWTGSNLSYPVPLEMALPLGLIVSELVTNAIKYAHPAKIAGKISLDCRLCENGGVLVEVSDDGVGLPDGFDPAKSGHLGFRLVRSLAAQIGATIKFESGELGLRVALRIPATRDQTEEPSPLEPRSPSSSVLEFPMGGRARRLDGSAWRPRHGARDESNRPVTEMTT
jgi:two-component sensor histidine kinase